MVLSKEIIELEIKKCEGAIAGFTEGIEIHRILLEGLKRELESINQKI